ncbi:hypothetical protein BC835DRAFT_1395358 [Cytidiella melzeri]|nr:hypothetical protein BC835DRAFT_1395358 [Cytidiella melzeri]
MYICFVQFLLWFVLGYPVWLFLGCFSAGSFLGRCLSSCCPLCRGYGFRIPLSPLCGMCSFWAGGSASPIFELVCVRPPDWCLGVEDTRE